MNLQSELLRAGIVSGIYLLIFFIAEVWRETGKPRTETTRKFVHLSAGAVCLSFSYLFSSHWTIFGLGVLFAAVMMLSKKYDLLKSVHDVKRRSGGSFYFPIAVYLCFLIATNAQKPQFYLIAILVLALSDSFAALIGGKYGLKLYAVEEENRSLEGSVVFFFCTFIIVLIGLLLLTTTGRAESILIAAFVALMVTAFESISLNGADNLFIPVGTLVVLLRIENVDIKGLLVRIGAVVLIFLLVNCIARYSKRIGLTGIIGITLTGYAAWILVRFDWAIPIIISLLLYGLTDLFIDKKSRNQERYRIRTVFYIVLVSFIWILAAAFTPLPSEVFFIPFAVNLTAHMGILWHRKALIDPHGYSLPFPRWIRNPNVLIRGTLLVLILTSVNLFVNKNLNPLLTLVLTFTGTVITELIYWRFESRNRGKISDIEYLKMTSVIVLIISIVLLIPGLMTYSPEILKGDYWNAH